MDQFRNDSDENGKAKFYNITNGGEIIGRMTPPVNNLTLSNTTLVGNYQASNSITAETNVVVNGTATLKTPGTIYLKPGFTANSGCNLTISVGAVTSDKYYYLKDHLGSIRVVVDTVGEIVSYTDYDPWGMILNGRSANYGYANDKYKFTGKELDTETGYFHFGARAYDGRLGRWNVIDPLDSQRSGLSPYNYCQNNPITLIDPTGMLDTKYVDKEGNPLAETNDGNDATVTVSNSQEFLDDYNNTSVLARDSKFQNSEWIKTFGTAMAIEGGANVQDWALASLGVSALDFSSEMLKKSFGHTTIRISSVKGISPWIYNGWGGGSRGNVKVLSTGKTLNGIGWALGFYNIFQAGKNLYTGERTGVEGWFEFGLAIGSTVTGPYGAAASLGYEVGKLHPLRAIGIDATKWFK